MTIEEKLELFKNSSIEEASQQSHAMLEEYKATLEAKYAERIELAKQRTEEMLKSKTDELMRSHNRELSAEYNNIKRDLGQKHHDVKKRIFADVRKKLEDYTKTAEYKALLISQIKAAARIARTNPVEIYIDAVDTEKLETLKAETGLPVLVSEERFLGGIKAVIPSKNILIDNSFLSRLNEEEEKFTI